MQTTEFPTHINVSAGAQASSNKVSQFKDFALRQNSSLIRDEVEKLKQFNTKIGGIVTQIQKNKTQCEQTIKNLKSQIVELDTKVSAYEKKQGASVEEQYKRNISGLQSEYLSICRERVKTANQINIKNLANLDIEDKKSKANEIFKWILLAFYNEPDNKFFWPNFKEEALENDKGKDFIERLGKVSPMNLTEGQKIKTEQFLENYNDYLTAPEIQDVKEQMGKLHKLGELFKRGYVISADIKNNEKLIEKHKQSTMEKDEEFMRWKARSEALKDRININEKYLKVLGEAESKLQPKIVSYSQVCENGEKLKSDFDSQGKWSPSINIDKENKSNCECSLF